MLEFCTFRWDNVFSAERVPLWFAKVNMSVQKPLLQKQPRFSEGSGSSVAVCLFYFPTRFAMIRKQKAGWPRQSTYIKHSNMYNGSSSEGKNDTSEPLSGTEGAHTYCNGNCQKSKHICGLIWRFGVLPSEVLFGQPLDGGSTYTKDC